MSLFEEGDEVHYDTSFYGKGKGVIVYYDDEKDLFLIMPNKKNLGVEYFFCFKEQLINTPF